MITNIEDYFDKFPIVNVATQIAHKHAMPIIENNIISATKMLDGWVGIDGYLLQQNLTMEDGTVVVSKTHDFDVLTDAISFFKKEKENGKKIFLHCITYQFASPEWGFNVAIV